MSGNLVRETHGSLSQCVSFSSIDVRSVLTASSSDLTRDLALASLQLPLSTGSKECRGLKLGAKQMHTANPFFRLPSEAGRNPCSCDRQLSAQLRTFTRRAGIVEHPGDLAHLGSSRQGISKQKFQEGGRAGPGCSHISSAARASDST
eukprot:1145568-Pelagomonas_calceolata.AAC.1